MVANVLLQRGSCVAVSFFPILLVVAVSLLFVGVSNLLLDTIRELLFGVAYLLLGTALLGVNFVTGDVFLLA